VERRVVGEGVEVVVLGVPERVVRRVVAGMVVMKVLSVPTDV
jgi:hypothetical protein